MHRLIHLKGLFKVVKNSCSNNVQLKKKFRCDNLSLIRTIQYIIINIQACENVTF